jgi:hypothetical protein
LKKQNLNPKQKTKYNKSDKRTWSLAAFVSSRPSTLSTATSPTATSLTQEGFNAAATSAAILAAARLRLRATSLTVRLVGGEALASPACSAAKLTAGVISEKGWRQRGQEMHVQLRTSRRTLVVASPHSTSPDRVRSLPFTPSREALHTLISRNAPTTPSSLCSAKRAHISGRAATRGPAHPSSSSSVYSPPPGVTDAIALSAVAACFLVAGGEVECCEGISFSFLKRKQQRHGTLTVLIKVYIKSTLLISSQHFTLRLSRSGATQARSSTLTHPPTSLSVLSLPGSRCTTSERASAGVRVAGAPVFLLLAFFSSTADCSALPFLHKTSTSVLVKQPERVASRRCHLVYEYGAQPELSRAVGDGVWVPSVRGDGATFISTRSPRRKTAGLARWRVHADEAATARALRQGRVQAPRRARRRRGGAAQVESSLPHSSKAALVSTGGVSNPRCPLLCHAVPFVRYGVIFSPVKFFLKAKT